MITPSPSDVHSSAQNGNPRSPARSIAWITLCALALFVVVRQLPTGTNLSHVDFRVEGGNSIEFCDPKNPQFIPVVAVRSPVSLTVEPMAQAPEAGHVADLVAMLKTSTGKTISPVDLLVNHTEKLHLLIFDPELRDYQHVHPTPGLKAGEWKFSFTPKNRGLYRIFADFTPSATGRGLYAGTDLQVAGIGSEMPMDVARPAVDRSARLQDGLIFHLEAAKTPMLARQVTDFEFSVARENGRPLVLEKVMDASAHLVAIDEGRTGFAHLHPVQDAIGAGGAQALYSKLNFKILIPKPGRYVIWAQVRVDGQDRYVPFWFDVK